MTGYFANCEVKELVLNADGKCTDFSDKELGNNAEELPDYSDDQAYDTSQMCHENQIR
jgi:hypothetical protein